MRSKKELKSLVEKRTNYRNEEIQQELEKYKEDIESYIENRLMECIRQHYSYCNIYFEDIYKIIKNKKSSNITKEDIYIFFKSYKNEFKKDGYIIDWLFNYEGAESMKIYFSKIDFILENPLSLLLILILVSFIFIVILLLY